MGVLTEAMMRLRDEIVSSRHVRVALLGDLVRQTNERCAQVSALCAGFAGDRAGAHRAWFGPVLSERQTSEKAPQRRPAQAAGIKAPAQKQPSATPKVESRGRASARPASARAARPRVAHSSRERRPLSKRLKKH